MRWWIARRTHDAAQPEEADVTDLLLSAYLDDDLAPAERDAFEGRLSDDARLRSDLAGLREVVAGLGNLEELRAPRPFTIAAGDARPPRGFSRLELGVRVGALAAAAAFVLAVGVDLQRGGSNERTAGDTVAVRSAAESTSSEYSAPAAPAAGGGNSAGVATAPERSLTPPTDTAAPASAPAVVPTTFVTQPTAAAATTTPASSAQRQQGQPSTPTPSPIASRTSGGANSTSTTTSALQGAAAPTTTPAVATAASVTSAAAPALAPVLTATATPTPPRPTPTPTPPAPPKADAATPAAVQGSGSGSTQVAPALPADSITSTPVAEERVAAPSIAPSTGSLGAGIGTDSPSGRVIVPAPAANDDWGQAAVRVSVTSREGIDSVRASEFGLGALALGLGGLTGWFWYLRRREAAANV